MIGTAVASLLSSWFTGGCPPSIPLAFGTLDWVDWWQVQLGLTFVLVTLFAPKGLDGLFDMTADLRSPNRRCAPLGPDQGALQAREATE